MSQLEGVLSSLLAFGECVGEHLDGFSDLLDSLFDFVQFVASKKGECVIEVFDDLLSIVNAFKDGINVDLGLGGDSLDDALEDLENDCFLVSDLAEGNSRG